MTEEKQKYYLMDPINPDKMVCITHREYGKSDQHPDKHITQTWCDGMNALENKRFGVTLTTEEMRKQAKNAYNASFNYKPETCKLWEELTNLL